MIFRYTVTCTGCRRQWHGEVTGIADRRFNPVRDMHIECQRCGPLDLTITRDFPASRKVERRQLAKPRTPMRGTPRPRG